MPIIERLTELARHDAELVGAEHRDLVVRLGRLRDAVPDAVGPPGGEGARRFTSLLEDIPGGWPGVPPPAPACLRLIEEAARGIPVRGPSSEIEIDIMRAALVLDRRAMRDGVRHHDGGEVELYYTERAARMLLDGHQLVTESRRTGRVDAGVPVDLDATLGRLGLSPAPGFPPGVDDPTCFDLDLACIDLFLQSARALAAVPIEFGAVAVDPPVLCEADVPGTEFTATFAGPAEPVDREDQPYRLYVGERMVPPGDIVRIAGNDIVFTLPEGRLGGHVFVRNIESIPAAQAVPVRTMRNLCGITGLQDEMFDVMPDPSGVYLAIVPQIGIQLSTDDDTSEACTTVRLRWSARYDDHPLWRYPPTGTSLEVVIVDEGDPDGPTLVYSGAAFDGSRTVPVREGGNHFSAVARIVADGAVMCREANHEFRFDATQHVRLESGRRELVVDRDDRGTVRVVRSCASDDRRVIRLRVSPLDGATIRIAGNDLDAEGNVDVPIGIHERTGEITFIPLTPGRVRFHVADAGGYTNAGDLLVFRIVAKRNALVLSGGTVKGSFQAGALLAFRESWAEIEPDIVTACSVGAINALALARKAPADPSGTVEAAETWLDLRNPANVFRLTPEAQDLADLLNLSAQDFLDLISGMAEMPNFLSILLSYLTSGEAWNELDEWVNAIVKTAFLGPIGLFIAGAESLIDDVIESFSEVKELTTLGPVQERVYAKLGLNVDADIAASGMTLRIATVSASDGRLYYVDEGARLIDASTRRLRGRIIETDVLLEDRVLRSWNPTQTQKLVVAALASSAQFGLIGSRALVSDARGNDVFMDGGHRELQPIQAAVDAGAHTAFVIGVQPTEMTRWPEDTTADWARPFFEVLAESGYPTRGPGATTTVAGSSQSNTATLAEQSILSRLGRGVDVLLSEVNQEERIPRGGHCDGMERVLITPDFEVHSSFDVHPGLIRINMAYGYMLAWDALAHHRGDIDDQALADRRETVNEIIRLRRKCLFREAEPWLVPQLARNGAFRFATLAAIRQLKQRIAVAVERRWSMCGADPACFPPDLRQTGRVARRQSVRDWYRTWEIHRRPVQFALLPFDIWSPQNVQLLYSFEITVASSSPMNPGARVNVPVPDLGWTEQTVPPAPSFPSLEVSLAGRAQIW